MHAATGLSPVCYTPTAIRISVHCVPAAFGLILVRCRIGIHLSWSVPPPTSTDMRLLLGVGSVPPTMGRSGIFPGIGSVSLTKGRSVSGVFFDRFRPWTGSGPLACYRTFTIFSWKLCIVIVNDNAFQSWNHSVGPSF